MSVQWMQLLREWRLPQHAASAGGQILMGLFVGDRKGRSVRYGQHIIQVMLPTNKGMFTTLGLVDW